MSKQAHDGIFPQPALLYERGTANSKVLNRLIIFFQETVGYNRPCNIHDVRAILATPQFLGSMRKITGNPNWALRVDMLRNTACNCSQDGIHFIITREAIMLSDRPVLIAERLERSGSK